MLDNLKLRTPVLVEIVSIPLQECRESVTLTIPGKTYLGISDISSILILGLVKMFCKLEFEGGQSDSVPDGPFTGTS